MAATNVAIHLLDPAFVRRFDRVFEVPLPDEAARTAIIEKNLEGVDSDIAPDDFAQIAKSTNGYNGADLKSLTRHAAMVPVRDSLRMVHSESDMECDGDSAKSTDAETVLIAALRSVW